MLRPRYPYSQTKGFTPPRERLSLVLTACFCMILAAKFNAGIAIKTAKDAGMKTQ
jgi:hypothetical protein